MYFFFFVFGFLAENTKVRFTIKKIKKVKDKTYKSLLVHFYIVHTIIYFWNFVEIIGEQTEGLKHKTLVDVMATIKTFTRSYEVTLVRNDSKFRWTVETGQSTKVKVQS